ncbi:uncharacterized protein [Mytilus edulis]|uniref:uncharacterized protein isoform X2 n=1 Tax=Mytilus edulis TaxID=6550 RepID=UPI0039F052CE
MELKMLGIVIECPGFGVVMCLSSIVQTKDGLWHGFRNVCFLAANYCKDSFFPGTNDGLWHGFRNVCFQIANCKDSFFPGTKDGLWHGFRNVCFQIANCKDSFFPGTKDEENNGIAGITAKSDFSWLKMNCGVDFEMFDGNGLQSALL